MNWIFGLITLSKNFNAVLGKTWQEVCSLSRSLRVEYLENTISDFDSTELDQLPELLKNANCPIREDLTLVRLTFQGAQNLVSKFFSKKELHPFLFPLNFVLANPDLQKLIKERIYNYYPGHVGNGIMIRGVEHWDNQEKRFLLRNLLSELHFMGSADLIPLMQFLGETLFEWSQPLNKELLVSEWEDTSFEWMLVDALYWVVRPEISDLAVSDVRRLLDLASGSGSSKIVPYVKGILLMDFSWMEGYSNLINLISQLEYTPLRSICHSRLLLSTLKLAVFNEKVAEVKSIWPTLLADYLIRFELYEIPYCELDDILKVFRENEVSLKEIPQLDPLKSKITRIHDLFPQHQGCLTDFVNDHVQRWRYEYFIKNHEVLVPQPRYTWHKDLISYWSQLKYGEDLLGGLLMGPRLPHNVSLGNLGWTDETEHFIIYSSNCLFFNEGRFLVNNWGELRFPHSDNYDLFWVAVGRLLAASLMHFGEFRYKFVCGDWEMLFGERAVTKPSLGLVKQVLLQIPIPKRILYELQVQSKGGNSTFCSIL